MSFSHYKEGQALHLHCLNNGIEFYSVLQCLIRMADSKNLEAIQNGFPGRVEELKLRWISPGGLIPGEE